MTPLSMLLMFGGAAMSAAGGFMAVTARPRPAQAGAVVAPPAITYQPSPAPAESPAPAALAPPAAPASTNLAQATLAQATLAPATLAPETSVPPPHPNAEPVDPAPPLPETALAVDLTPLPAPETPSAAPPSGAAPVIPPPPVIPPVQSIPPVGASAEPVQAAPAPPPEAVTAPVEPVAVAPAAPEPASPEPAAPEPPAGLDPSARFALALQGLGVPADHAAGLFEQAQGLTHLYADLPPTAALAARCLNIIDYEDPGLLAQAPARDLMDLFLRGLLGPASRMVWPNVGDPVAGCEVSSGAGATVSAVVTPGFTADGVVVAPVVRAD